MKCSREGCYAPAELVPVLSFKQYDNPTSSPASVDLPMAVCQAHAIPDVPTFVTIQGWGSLCFDMARRGLALPDYASATIAFRSIDAAKPVRSSVARWRRN